ncbi:MAG: GGDEF domain-containing protein [Proteobacteria bacterium]|nr:GGDEF domain-containing protein [Pseudomonadota bacterium]
MPFILFLDLDKFKKINDIYGHDKGDMVLVEFSQSVSSCIRKSDTLTRLGGDEFVLIAVDIDEQQAVDHLACKIYQVLEEPVDFGVVQWQIKTSIGVVITDDHTITSSILYKQADQALY